VIEGLRVLPAYQDARNQPAPNAPPVASKTCEECQKLVPADVRQSMGCGFEPPIEKPRAIWQPAWWVDRGLKATACPAYTTSLPVVREIVDAYPHWKNGTLTEYLDGEAPNPVALEYLTALDAGIRENEAAALKKAQS
jgi:hypothetical protein